MIKIFKYHIKSHINYRKLKNLRHFSFDSFYTDSSKSTFFMCELIDPKYLMRFIVVKIIVFVA